MEFTKPISPQKKQIRQNGDSLRRPSLENSISQNFVVMISDNFVAVLDWQKLRVEGSDVGPQVGGATVGERHNLKSRGDLGNHGLFSVTRSKKNLFKIANLMVLDTVSEKKSLATQSSSNGNVML